MVSNNSIIDVVKDFRKKRIEGKIVDLIPFTMEDARNVVEIRNKKKNRYFLNQTYDITVESQAKWYENYLKRYDDIYWCVYNKQNQFIGTVRVYEIDGDNDICDQGSLMIDEEFSASGPYAIEVEILTLDFIFNILKIENVINEDRADNKVMNNLTRKLGFKYIKDTQNDGVKYKYYLLKREDYLTRRETFESIIN